MRINVFYIKIKYIILSFTCQTHNIVWNFNYYKFNTFNIASSDVQNYLPGVFEISNFAFDFKLRLLNYIIQELKLYNYYYSKIVYIRVDI